MASHRLRRIGMELKDIKSDTISMIQVEPIDDECVILKGQFKGPPDTPYEGGTYIVDIRIPPEYPFRPPQMKFITKIWHPNVSSQTGAICLDTLSSQWSPVLTVKSALISLQSLLSTPEPKDPQDAEVASMLIRHPKDFEHVAREWAVKYAGAPRMDSKSASGSGGSDTHSMKANAKLQKEKERKAALAAYHGYNKDLIDRFVAMGFDVEQVVSAFEYVGIDKMGGEDYELEEAYMGDITARLFGEA